MPRQRKPHAPGASILSDEIDRDPYFSSLSGVVHRMPRAHRVHRNATPKTAGGGLFIVVRTTARVLARPASKIPIATVVEDQCPGNGAAGGLLPRPACDARRFVWVAPRCDSLTTITLTGPRCRGAGAVHHIKSGIMHCSKFDRFGVRAYAMRGAQSAYGLVRSVGQPCEQTNEKASFCRGKGAVRRQLDRARGRIVSWRSRQPQW